MNLSPPLVLLLAFVSVSPADMLRLRDGKIINGQWLGGDARTIRFAVGDHEQRFSISQIDSITFDDAAPASAGFPNPAPRTVPLPHPIANGDPVDRSLPASSTFPSGKTEMPLSLAQSISQPGMSDRATNNAPARLPSDCGASPGPRLSVEEALTRGREAASNRRFADAMRWFCMAEEQGSIRASTNIGALYRDGLGIPANPAKAMERFTYAADRGDTLAMFNIGYMYDRGIGGPIRHSDGVSWYRKAAALGEPRAKPYFVCYSDGVTQSMIRLLKIVAGDPQLLMVSAATALMNLREVDSDYHVFGMDVLNVRSDAEYSCTATIAALRAIKSVLPNKDGEPETYLPGLAGAMIPLIQTYDIRRVAGNSTAEEYSVTLGSLGALGSTRIAISKPYSLTASVPRQ